MKNFGKISFYTGIFNIALSLIPTVNVFVLLLLTMALPMAFADIWQKNNILKNKSKKYGILGIFTNLIALLILLIYIVFIYN